MTEHIDRRVSTRGKGPGVATYLLVAELSRCLAPCSKAAVGDWFAGTVLRRLIHINTCQLTSQRYWDNRERVGVEAIAGIEQDITRQMVRGPEGDLSRVLFDATDFSIFMDSFNHGSTLAARGKSKEGWATQRIVVSALLVSSPGHVPLRSTPTRQLARRTDLCEPHRAACPALPGAEGRGRAHHHRLRQGQQLRGQPRRGGRPSFHFIGSLVPTQHPDLLSVQEPAFRSLAWEGRVGVKAYRTTRKVFGVERTVVVTYNQNLFVAQRRTLLCEISKRQQRLVKLHGQLLRHRRGEIEGGEAPAVPSNIQKIEGWLSAQHGKDLHVLAVTEEQGLAKLQRSLRQGRMGEALGPFAR